jgi:O-acetyl-ADP-ribose deacetylase (regulator of RNase III)
VNLAIIVRPKGEFVHEELQRYLLDSGKRYVDPGTVVSTGPGSVPVKKILHAVSIDRSYASSVELVTKTIASALTMACELGARVVTMPALATGFGPLSMEEFATALGQATERDWTPVETLKIVLKHEEDATRVRDRFQETSGRRVT